MDIDFSASILVAKKGKAPLNKPFRDEIEDEIEDSLEEHKKKN